MKSKEKFAVSSSDLYLQIQSTNNVVTRSTLLDILKSRAERGDLESFTCWITAIQKISILRNNKQSKLFDSTICINMVQKHLETDENTFKGLGSIDLEKETINNYYVNNVLTMNDEKVKIQLFTLFITGLIINYYISLVNNKTNNRDEFKAVSNIILYGVYN